MCHPEKTQINQFQIEKFHFPFSEIASLTPQIIENLEEQLHFKAKVVYLAEMDFDRFARFMTMDCALCKYQFMSFDECYVHFLVVHKRSAFWNCCNLLLETPYDVLDHIRYHESIEDFK